MDAVREQNIPPGCSFCSEIEALSSLRGSVLSWNLGSFTLQCPWVDKEARSFCGRRLESHKYKCEVSQRVPSLKAAPKPSEAAELGRVCSGKGSNTIKALAKGSAGGKRLLQVVWEDRAWQ